MKLRTLAVLVALGLTGCSNDTPQSNPGAPGRLVNVVTLDGSEAAYRQFSGVLEARQRSDLAFKVAGRLEPMVVQVGDRVEAGQLLARLESHDYTLTVKELEARLSEAQATWRLARNELARVEQATADNAMADVNLDRARTGEARAAAAVVVMERNLEKARDGVRYTELRAPFAGQVGQRFVEAHELVSDGQPILSLHTPDALQVVLDVPHSQLTRFHQGQSAQIHWFGSPERVAAVATEVASLPHPIKRTYAVTFALDDRPAALFAGKAVQLRLVDTEAPAQHCVPASALTTGAGQSQLVRLSDHQAEPVPVEVLEQGPERVCVTGDLNAGDRIVVAGAHYLKAGDPIDAWREVRR
ncbi:efflux RND transporter periplasmic adaptor subunit [Ferrimonas balearica]|uniref:efflux RND transporter periplasmic adaptor subunit n=1 Tax=Ferrimonas balearica TaxID=44012 RepID=UPI001C992780|nr:efflux RND transporter periplasmic adaptor subunit [Ferrimonas balearica]MBY5990872.1 efflux RND transporter periplasmic adaptor subunit [Ferrimonas balearica]